MNQIHLVSWHDILISDICSHRTSDDPIAVNFKLELMSNTKWSKMNCFEIPATLIGNSAHGRCAYRWRHIFFSFLRFHVHAILHSCAHSFVFQRSVLFLHNFHDIISRLTKCARKYFFLLCAPVLSCARTRSLLLFSYFFICRRLRKWMDLK